MSKPTTMKPSDFFFFMIQLSLMYFKFGLNINIPLWIVFSPTLGIFLISFIIAIIIVYGKKK